MKECKFIVLIWFTSLWFSSHDSLFCQSRSDCFTCHSDPSLSTERNGKHIPLFVQESVLDKSPHRKLVCVACHSGFNAGEIPHKEKIEPVDCSTCHKDVHFRHTFHPQLARAILSKRKPDVSCKDCHGTHDVVSPKIPGSKFHSTTLTESCGECHGDVRETFDKSAHGESLATGIRGAPNCLTCHRQNITRGDERRDLLAHKVTQEKLCLSCHLDKPDVRARTSPTAGFIAAYERSVHGAALLKGKGSAANCVDCHGSHEMKKGLEPAAHVNKLHIPETCGQCHSLIEKGFGESVHGKAVRSGNVDAPVCTDCHGEHNILSPQDPRAAVAQLNVSGQVCSPCHSSLRLSEKYGIAADRYKTFSDSYHGLAIRAGSLEVANCASCHGTHNIKPSSDSTSTIHKANLASTCGRCHAGANERFAIGSVHVVMAQEEEPVLYWIATAYIILIVTTVGSMVIHNALDFLKKARQKLGGYSGLAAEEPLGHRLYLRMTLSERLQHGTLMISFVLLVITGFMLRYPEAGWVEAVRSLSSSAFELRSLLHRIAGVVLITASLYHVHYVLFTRRGRELIRDLLPKKQDIVDAMAVMRYNLGLSTSRPKLGRFTYIEKSEYWALLWGTVVMAITGLMMWFDNTFMGLLGKVGWDVARTVHFYEAWLATLAIIVWHFYYVIFNPDVYPMNVAWLTGHLSEAEMLREHPLELEEIHRNEMGVELSTATGTQNEPETRKYESKQAK